MAQLRVRVGAPAEPAATWFVSTAGSDAALGTSPGTALLTFEEAYERASAGQVVEVAAGEYPKQTIPNLGGRVGPHVVFRPAAGAVVTVGADTPLFTPDIQIFGSWVEFRDMTVRTDWYTRSTARDVVMRRMTGRKFFMASCERIQVYGGLSTSPDSVGVSQIKSAGPGQQPARNIVVEDHEWFRCWRPEGDDTHMESLHVMGVDGLTLRNCTIREALGTTAALSFNIHDSAGIVNVLVEGLMVEDTYGAGGYPQPTGTGPSVNLSDREPGMGITFLNCDLRDATNWVAQGAPVEPGAIRVEGCTLRSLPSHPDYVLVNNTVV